MAETITTKRRGELVALLLAGSWRSSSLPPLDLTEAQLDEVTPLLYGSGAGALGWWRLRSSELSETPSAIFLHQAYRLIALQSAIHEQKIEKLFRVLRLNGIEGLLAKGWAASQLYPDTALRPYGDIDLLVHPTQIATAREVLNTPEMSDCWIDLHERFSELDDRTTEGLFARSTRVRLGDQEVRVLSGEDHLALLAVHLLKHGGWRPLWLCDIAAAVESLPPNFSWDVCLGNNHKRANWITCVISLAGKLLGADTSSVPKELIEGDIPSWLTKSVLSQWASPFAINQAPMKHSAPMGSYVRHPFGVFKALRERWPNPILATISVNGEFNEIPRLPYQLGNCALRMTQFLMDLPTRLRSQT